MRVITTERLYLRHFSADDAAFTLQLLTSDGWLKFIGDRGIRSIADATQYINDRLIASYQKHGYGLYLVELKNGKPIGMCGLVNRPSLADVDIGFAFLPEFMGQGYAYEAASATMNYGNNVLKLPRIVAITAEDNVRSIKLLQKIGLRFERVLISAEEGTNKLFVPR